MHRHAKALFTIAALFNFGVALGLTFGWPLTRELFQLSEAGGSNRLIANVAAVLVATFGYAYFMASLDPERYRPYVVLGVVGKSLVGLVALPVFFAGGEGWILAGLALGDVVFVVLFVNFLRRYPAAAAS